ncbi:MAG TPA: hypothetical protein DEP67_01480 [Lachnospiraceae bacterium]|nr:hypothetical protein [Lachnospiraceae bacterium]
MMRKLVKTLTTVSLIIGMTAANVSAADVMNDTESLSEAESLADGNMLGAWELPDDLALTKEAKDAFDKAMEGLTGVSYVPVALLGTQIVAGTNYSILCRSTVVYPGAETTYAIVYIYEDLEGQASILRIQNLELNAQEVEDKDRDKTADTFAIIIESGKDLITDCPKSAKAGETVTISTYMVTDATLTLSVEDVDGAYVREDQYEFIMPNHDVIVNADLVFDQPGA